MWSADASKLRRRALAPKARLREQLPDMQRECGTIRPDCASAGGIQLCAHVYIAHHCKYCESRRGCLGLHKSSKAQKLLLLLEDALGSKTSSSSAPASNHDMTRMLHDLGARTQDSCVRSRSSPDSCVDVQAASCLHPQGATIIECASLARVRLWSVQAWRVQMLSQGRVQAWRVFTRDCCPQNLLVSESLLCADLPAYYTWCKSRERHRINRGW
jgi:hypothetical protein